MTDRDDLRANNDQSDMEIEHWCPVCDRQILPSAKPVQAAVPTPVTVSATTSPRMSKKKMTLDDFNPPTATQPSPSLTDPVVQRSVTPTYQQKKRLSTGAVRGSRISLHRTKTTAGYGNGKKKGSENLFLLDLVSALNQDGGTATREEASPDAGSDPMPTMDDQNVNAVKGEGRHGAEETVNVEEGGGDGVVKRPLRRGNSDRALDSHIRAAGITDKSASAKRKSTGQEVLLPLARVKSTTKAKAGAKSRPKALNLITTNLTGANKELTRSATVSRKPSSAGILPTPDIASPISAPILEPRICDDPRRKLYCSDECYNIDIGKSPAIAQLKQEVARPTIKRQLTLEMPWYQESKVEERWESHGFRSQKRDYDEDSDEEQLIMIRSPASPGSRRERKHSNVVDLRTPSSPNVPTYHRRQSTFSADGATGDGQAARPKRHRRDTSQSLPAFRNPVPLTPTQQEGQPLYFRRMPGVVTTSPVNEGPTIHGRHSTHIPPWFDYGTYLQKQEQERRKRQRDLNDHLGSKSQTPNNADEQALVKRKAKLSAERKRLDAKRKEIVGYSNDEEIDPSEEMPWWRIDEREDWRTYWVAREGGLEVSFEDWQLRRHKERVESVLKSERKERYAADLKLARRHDGKKVAERPMLIRVASQPTLTDHRITLQDLATKPRPKTKKALSSTSGSEVASPLEMGRTKALPHVIPEGVVAPMESPFTTSPTRITSFSPPRSILEEHTPRRARLTNPQRNHDTSTVTPNKRWTMAAAPASPLALHSFSGTSHDNSVRTIRRKQEDDSFARNIRTLSPLVVTTPISVAASPLDRTLSPKKGSKELSATELSNSPDISMPPSGINSGSSGEESSSWSGGDGPTRKRSHARHHSYNPIPERLPLPTRDSTDSMEPPAHLLQEVNETQATTDTGLAWFLKNCAQRVNSMPNASILSKWGITAMAPLTRADKRRSLWDVFGSSKP